MSSPHAKPQPTRRAPLALMVCGLLAAAMAAGCETSVPRSRGTGPDVIPCAERLHEICGHLLLYYSINDKLPERLADLKTAGPEPLPPLTCPDSGKPYVYNRSGLTIQGRPGRLVLYDPAPTHSGMRWGILADDPVEGKPLTARVVRLPENPVFSAAKP